MQVEYDKYKEMDFSCHCGWQGKGAELSHGDFSEVHLIGDLECPECHSLVAFWSSPVKESKVTRKKKK